MASQKAPFDAIVFDLGGVLIELAGVSRMLGWLGEHVSEEELWRRWLASESVRGFECGRLGAAEFAQAFLAEFQIPVSGEQFLAEFTVWPRAPYPGASDLLKRLHEEYTVACLSNTNSLHWSRIDAEMDLLPHFHSHFASHVVGFLKPDREIFEHLVEQLGFPPERILFLDDNQLNVDGARAAGITAYRVAGLDATIHLLTELGVLAAEA